MAGSSQRERVELLQVHKNAGTEYPVGHELVVSSSTAALAVPPQHRQATLTKATVTPTTENE
ncbi:hypothetical protein [Paludibacterium denitrificans]|uniref:Uncharacterized protein n=1 Tax=Paludibacterium denitrificans TaxID=2675226 RepID=A0A844GHH7_9NEIS|nr:hypothetical protein [Paludibacterium denitrificans]MTD33945.1 hypothetical protein [Paludibacterium denitrificans]